MVRLGQKRWRPFQQNSPVPQKIFDILKTNRHHPVPGVHRFQLTSALDFYAKSSNFYTLWRYTQKPGIHREGEIFGYFRRFQYLD